MTSKYSTTDQPIGRKIESVRLLRNMTQKAVANAVGLTKEGYGKIERSNSITEQRLNQIATVLRVTTKGILEFSEDKLYTANKKPQHQNQEIDKQPALRILLLIEQIAQAQAQLILIKQETIDLLKARATIN